MSVFSSIHPSLFSFCTQHAISRVPPYEPDPAQGFLLLKGSFFLQLLLVGGQVLGFCKAASSNFVCKRFYINEDELIVCFGHYHNTIIYATDYRLFIFNVVINGCMTSMYELYIHTFCFDSNLLVTLKLW